MTSIEEPCCRQRDELRSRIAEFDGFPNLTAMREAMVATADENAALRARLAEAEALLRELRDFEDDLAVQKIDAFLNREKP